MSWEVSRATSIVSDSEFRDYMLKLYEKIDQNNGHKTYLNLYPDIFVLHGHDNLSSICEVSILFDKMDP